MDSMERIGDLMLASCYCICLLPRCLAGWQIASTTGTTFIHGPGDRCIGHDRNGQLASDLAEDRAAEAEPWRSVLAKQAEEFGVFHSEILFRSTCHTDSHHSDDE